MTGVRPITAGGGGAPLYSPDPGSYPYVVTAAAVNHFCEIDIQDYMLHFTAREKNGSVVDSFTLYHAVPGDLDGDNDVDRSDLRFLGEHWLDENCQESNNWCGLGDINQLGSVDINDFGVFTEHWGEKLPLEIKVNSGNDDAEELNADGHMYLDSSDLELVNDDSSHGGDQTIGLRFGDVQIEQGEQISRAYIQFTVDETLDSNPCSLTIRAQTADDAGPFT